jgi:hypothetical protein
MSWLRTRTAKASAIVLSLLLGLAAGGGTAWYFTHGYERLPSLFDHYGPWNTDKTDALAHNQLLLAHAAVFGTFGLPPSEVLYLKAVRDSSGQMLSAQGRYLVCGRPFEAVYWSVAAYRNDGQFFETPSRKSSFNGDNTQMRPDGSFCLSVQAAPATENWLPMTGRNKVELVLRIYRPSAATRANLSQLVPSIVRAP